MRWLLTLAMVLIGVLSLGWSISWATHLTLLLPGLGMLWLTDVTWRPVVRCRYCDKGRYWDVQGKHYGQHCGGLIFGLGSCGATGKKLRPGAKTLVILGQGKMLRNLPSDLRVDDDPQ